MTRHEFVLYQFQKPHDASSDAHYSLAPAAMVDRYFTKSQLVEEFGGWTEYWHETTDEAWIGVWGERKATRFRRMLKEKGAIFRIEKSNPPQQLHWRTSIYGEHALEHLNATRATDS